MNELNLTTPSLLFSAISLILLAYTNRFLSYASIVRHLKEKYENDPEAETTSLAQIDNLYRRLNLIRAMQILGAGSLLVCLAAMFFYYLEWNLLGGWVFGLGMVLLALSLCLCIWEIQISVEALNLNLRSLKKEMTPSLRRRPDDETLQREKSKGKSKKKNKDKNKNRDKGQEAPATPTAPQATQRQQTQSSSNLPLPVTPPRASQDGKDRPRRDDAREANRGAQDSSPWSTREPRGTRYPPWRATASGTRTAASPGQSTQSRYLCSGWDSGAG